MTNPLHYTPIEPDVRYSVGGHDCSGAQIEKALAACRVVAEAWAVADEANDGDGAVSEYSMEVARDLANEALANYLDEINDWAQKQNYFNRDDY